MSSARATARSARALRGGRVADLGGQPDAVGQQILDFVEFFGVVGEPGQYLERLGQRALLFQALAAGQGQRADHAVADPLRVGGGGGQVRPGGGGLAAMEADHGGDAVIAAGHARILDDFLDDAYLGQGVVPAAGVEQQLAETAARLGPADHDAGPVGELLGLAGRGESPVVLVEVA